MFRYQYFIKKTAVPYTQVLKYKCLRVPDGDARIPELTETYKPIGWSVFIAYPYKPTEQTEIFQLKMRFQGWDHAVEIDDIDAEASPKKMK